MINIINTVSGISRVNVDSAWYSKDEYIDYVGNYKNQIKNNHYLFVELKFKGLTANQKIGNVFLDMYYRNAYNNSGVKVIKCNDIGFNGNDILNKINSFTGNEEAVENILIEGTATEPEDNFSAFRIDLTNAAKDITSENNSLIIAINFQFGLSDDFEIYCPYAKAGMSSNSVSNPTNCEAVITEIVGINSAYKYEQYGLLNSGVANVNLATGKNIYTNTLLSSISKKMPIVFSIYQNFEYINNVKHFHYNVVPNFHYKVYRNEFDYVKEDNYIIEDASGLKSYYIKRNKLLYSDEELKQKYNTKDFENGTIYYSAIDTSYIHVENSGTTSIVHLYDRKENYIKFVISEKNNDEYTLIQEVGDTRGNKLVYYWDGKRISKIENTKGEEMLFYYTSEGYINKVSLPCINQYVLFEENLTAKTFICRKYSSTNNQLIDETCLCFNGDSTLKQIKDCKTNYYLDFTYYTNKKVHKVGAYNNTGGIKQYEMTYSYSDKYTKVTDLNNDFMYYHFNDYGLLQLVMDSHGKSITYNYDEFECGISKKLSGVSKVQNNSRNLIENHSFENDNIFSNDTLGWKKSGDINSKINVVKDGVIGNKCLRIESSSNDSLSIWQDIVNVIPGTYKFKGFIKNLNLTPEIINKVNLYVSYKYNIPSQSEIVEQIKNVSLIETQETWYEFNAGNIIIPETAYNVSIKVGINILEADTEIYLDDLQLIINSNYLRSNLIENGYMDFIDSNNKPSGWTLLNCDSNDKVVNVENDALHLDVLGKKAFKISAKNITVDSNNEFKNKVIYKRLPISGKKGEQLTFSVYAKACVSSNITFRSFVRFINNNIADSDYIFDFEKYLDNWQMLTRAITAVDDYSAVIVGVEYIGSNQVLLDCFQLYKESFGTLLKYDDNGNMIGIDTGNGITERYIYDDKGNLIETYNEDGSHYQYEYNENDLIVKARDMFGNIVTLEYDDDDRVIRKTLKPYNGEAIITSNTYDDTNNEEIIINEFGLRQINKLDNLKRVTSRTLEVKNSVTNLNEVYSVTNFEYYDNSQLKKFNMIIDGIKHGNILTYDDFGNVKTVQSENGTLYELSYDDFGKLITVKLNNHTVEYHHYNTPTSQYYKSKLDGITIAANGGYYELLYNELDQIKEIKLNNITIANYEYDEYGNVYKLSTTNNGFLKHMYFTYDLKGQLLKIKTSDNQEYTYTYDELGNIQTKTYNINDKIRSIGYQYGFENNQFNKYSLVDRMLRKYGDDVVYNNFNGFGINGAKPILNTCTNAYDEELGLNLINFNDKYDFINYKMSTFNSYEGSKYDSWKSDFNSKKTFFMLIKPTGSFALENLFSFGTIDENETVHGIELMSHLAVNATGKIIYYNDSPSSPVVTSSETLKLNEWNLVGIQFKKPLIGSNKMKIFVNTSATSYTNIDEVVKDLNYLIVGYQTPLNSSNNNNQGSSYASSTTTSNLTMPFKIGLMSFGAYDYQNDDFKNLYNDCRKYLSDKITYQANSTIYYDSSVYDGFDVVTLNGAFTSSKGLKPYETPEIDTSIKTEKPQMFKYDEELDKFVYGCYKEQTRSLKYILPLKDKGTIALRFKTEAMNKSRTVFSLKNLHAEIFNLTIDSSNKLKFWYNSSLSSQTNVNVRNSERTLDNSNWHHVVITYNQNILQVFVDGISSPLYARSECTSLEGAILSLGNSFSENTSLYGCLEMLAYSDLYQNGLVINKILTNGKTISVSDEYDTIGRLRKNVISVKNKTLNIDYEYDKTRITKQSFWNDDEISYEYDVVGNVENITYNDNESSVNYKYNKLGMLEEETLTDGTVTSYTYDENGNIKTKRSILNEVVILDEEYTYHNVIKDRLMYVTNKLTNSISKQLVYDSNNEFYPSSINGENLVCEGNLLKSYKGHTFEYDSNGTRTKIIKRNSSGELVKTTSFVLEGTNIISMTINELSREYKLDFTYDANSKLIGLSTIQGNYFYVRDITGNIIGLIDSNGNYVIQYKYDAWGNLLSNLPSIDDDTATIAAKYNPFMYKGYYYDVETKLFYCNSRYYSPELCRFISPDSIEYLDPSSIPGLNLYCYCHNNPICYYDPSGHIALWLLCGIILGAIGLIGGGIYAGVKSSRAGNTGWDVVGDVALGGLIGGAIGFTVGALIGAGISGALTGSFASPVKDVIAGGIRIYQMAKCGGATAAGYMVLDNLSNSFHNYLHVFWSGKDFAKERAMSFAQNNGGITLEMTRLGKYLETKPYNPDAWMYASQNFANQVRYGDTVRAILYYGQMRPDAIWFSEEAILIQRLVEIIRGGL